MAVDREKFIKQSSTNVSEGLVKILYNNERINFQLLKLLASECHTVLQICAMNVKIGLKFMTDKILNNSKRVDFSNGLQMNVA